MTSTCPRGEVVHTKADTIRPNFSSDLFPSINFLNRLLAWQFPPWQQRKWTNTKGGTHTCAKDLWDDLIGIKDEKEVGGAATVLYYVRKQGAKVPPRLFCPSRKQESAVLLKLYEMLNRGKLSARVYSFQFSQGHPSTDELSAQNFRDARTRQKAHCRAARGRKQQPANSALDKQQMPFFVPHASSSTKVKWNGSRRSLLAKLLTEKRCLLLRFALAWLMSQCHWLILTSLQV